MTNVLPFRVIEGGGSDAIVPVNRVLAGARKADLTDVVVLGFDADGMVFAASSHGPGDTNWLIDVGKNWILQGCPQD